MSRTPHTETEHLSQLALDRLLAGETQDTEALRAHLDACERCRERYAALEAEQEAYMTDAHVAARVDALMAVLEAPGETKARVGAAPDTGRGWLRRWQVWAPLATAAALALLVLWPRQPGSGPTRSPALKDPPALQVLVVEPGGTRRLLAPDQALPRGTALGFRAGCDRDCAVLLAAIGDTGPARIVEHEQPAPWQLAPGQWNPLPAGLELGGPVRLAALFCEAAPERAVLLDLLAQHHAAAPGQPRDLDQEPPAAPAGCVLRSVRVRVR